MRQLIRLVASPKIQSNVDSKTNIYQVQDILWLHVPIPIIDRDYFEEF